MSVIRGQMRTFRLWRDQPYTDDTGIPADAVRSCGRQGCSGTFRPITGTQSFDADGSAMVDLTCDQACGLHSVHYWQWTHRPPAVSPTRLAMGEPGYAVLMGEVRLGDFYDPWGTALAWMGAIADVMYLRFGEVMPEFVPAAGLSIPAIENDYPAGMVLDMLDSGEIDEDAMTSAYTVLNRYADWARAAGRDY